MGKRGAEQDIHGEAVVNLNVNKIFLQPQKLDTGEAVEQDKQEETEGHDKQRETEEHDKQGEIEEHDKRGEKEEHDKLGETEEHDKLGEPEAVPGLEETLRALKTWGWKATDIEVCGMKQDTTVSSVACFKHLVVRAVLRLTATG